MSITITDLDRLARAQNARLISLYMPTEVSGRDTEQNRIRFKNLMSALEDRAEEEDISKRELAAATDALTRLQEDTNFWRNQGRGLAVFAHGGHVETYRLSEEVEELVTIGDRFCVRPLLGSLKAGNHWFVLALSQKRTRLIECSRESAREVDAHDLPERLSDVVGYDWEEESLQFHSGATPKGRQGGAGVFHAQGGAGEDTHKEELARFLGGVADAVDRFMEGREAPLVVMGVDYLIPIFKDKCGYDGLVQRGVEGNPDHLSAEEVRDATLGVAEPELESAVSMAVERLKSLEGTAGVVSGIERVLPAASESRVGTLYVDPSARVWGRFEEETGSLTDVSTSRVDGDEDLVDLAVWAALVTGARVVPASSEDLPDDAQTAAVLRYAGPEEGATA